MPLHGCSCRPFAPQSNWTNKSTTHFFVDSERIWYAQCLRFPWKCARIFHSFFLASYHCGEHICRLFMRSSVFPYQIISLAMRIIAIDAVCVFYVIVRWYFWDNFHCAAVKHKYGKIHKKNCISMGFIQKMTRLCGVLHLSLAFVRCQNYRLRFVEMKSTISAITM